MVVSLVVRRGMAFLPKPVKDHNILLIHIGGRAFFFHRSPHCDIKPHKPAKLMVVLKALDKHFKADVWHPIVLWVGR